MERYGIGSRILAVLLALTMLVSYIPGTAQAAIGDILPGDPGIMGEPDTQDTISWPIKVYDYLADGMLFEAAYSNDTHVYAHNGGSYGGGKPMPMTGTIRGIDYTSVAGYYDFNNDTYTERYAFMNWGSKSAYSVRYGSDATEVARSIVQPVKDLSPMYLHLEHTGDSTTRSYGWISNFAKDEGQYMSKEDIRYAVIVYRTNELYVPEGHGVRLYWSVSDSDYDADYNYYGGDIDISDVTELWGWTSGSNHTGLLAAQEVNVPYSEGWSYVVVDMKSDFSGGDYGIAANWDMIDDERIAGVGMGLPLMSNGEAMDISHIAYFGSPEEAERFGQKCVAFDEDPGEYLGYTISMTHSVSGGTGTSTSGKPAVSSKGWDFTTAGAKAWNDSVFNAWTASYGMTTSQRHNGYRYVNVTNPDAELDSAYIWDSDTYSDIDSMRYVTVIYRTHGITAPAMGLWLADDVYGIQVGCDPKYRVMMTASEDNWVAFTYDLYWLQDRFGLAIQGWVDTFTQIGILFPGFTSAGQSMDIAYIDYHSTSTQANSFAAAATKYLNGYVATGDSVVTTLSISSTSAAPEMWNMGNNQAFSMLYASSGGGWVDDGTAGGENLWTNGYYSYQIGHNYTYQHFASSSNEIRERAAALGYPVSDSIFLLNTYGMIPEYLYGVTFDTDNSGYAIDSTKWFDMSQLELGYTLYSAMRGSGVMTAGLLESSLATYQGVDGKSHTVMQYKDDAVSYIASLLQDTLTIPERDYWGYNYNYVMGTPSPQFGEDVDGDGKLDMAEDLDYDGYLDPTDEDINGNGMLDPGEDLDGDYYLDRAEDMDGDGVLDVDEDVNDNGILDAQDLASALRQLLRITFPEDVETIQDQTSHGTVGARFGSYAQTAQKFGAGPNGENLLIGPFLQCAPHIETVYDAAWYLLHNLFVPGSYNEVRDEYDTLVLSKATLSDGKEAYVFDSGFTRADATSATVYDKENKTIYQTDVADKHQYCYMDGYSTALCPFLPIDVDDTTGPYAVTGTPYFRDNGAEGVSDFGATYADQNYSFVLEASGQFTYNSEITQYLEVAGDDDMYLFINGELVMDVGACHSITNVYFAIEDYVNAAYRVMEELPGYQPGMSDEDFEQLLADLGIVGDEARHYRRYHRLYLIDGQRCPIEFYYMKRHGWNSNLRLVSNFQIQAGEDEDTDNEDILAVGSCGDTLDWVLHANGVLEILGEGDMDMFADPDSQPWAAYRDRITDVTIGEGVTSIGSYAFYGHSALQEITIPSGVKRIEAEAFAYCDGMKRVSLSEGLNDIGDYAFAACTALTQLQLPQTLTSLGYCAFTSCSSLSTIQIPGSVSKIGGSAFVGCYGLTKVEVAEGVTVIDEFAFVLCQSLTTISLPESLRTVVRGAFRDTGLQTVEYAGSLDQWSLIEIEAENDPLLQADITFGKEHFHSYEAVTEAATCTSTGTTTYICPVCGDSYTEIIPATGHDYEAVVTEATCTEAGYTTHTCTACGDSYTDSETEALGHSYEAVTTEPTCTEAGSAVYTCDTCGDSYTETIPATRHSYSGGVCTVCGEADPDAVTDPGLSLSYPTLSFEDEIYYNVYYSVSDTTSVVEMGLMLLPSYDPDATIDDAVQLVPGFVTNGVVYLAKSEGIPAANMGDTVYFKVYAKLTDGSYAYSEAGGYNAKAYTQQIVSDEASSPAMRSLVVAMVNYGAEAQKFFGHNTGALVNAVLTDEQKALVDGYDESMVDALIAADSSKLGSFTRVNSNFKELYPSVSFDGAFSINFYCTPAIPVDSGMTLYYWDTETYGSISEFTVDNATGSMEMTVSNSGQYWGNVPGIAAKEIDKTYYVSCVFQSNGETITTGIIPYSLGRYCEGKAAIDGDPQQAFAQATAVYGYYAKQYFNGIA